MTKLDEYRVEIDEIDREIVQLFEKRMKTVGYVKNTEIEVNGRHDPCIVQRAVSVIESAAAIAVLDMLYGM